MTKRHFKPIDAETMNALFLYENGNLISKVDRGPANNRVRKGDVVGCLSKTGYLNVKVNGQVYLVHRVIYTMLNGDIPNDLFIDHANGIRTDNRIENIRLATPMQNIRNQKKAQKDNKLGVLGVGEDKRASSKGYKNKFRARIRVDGSLKCLGYFPTVEMASEAYQAARTKYFEDFS